MAKWRIPRHKPRSAPEWERADRNQSRKFQERRKHRMERRERERRRDMAYLELAARQGDADRARTARAVISQCAKKTKLSLGIARKCATSLSHERNVVVAVYLCPWCGSYHLTSHPSRAREYAYVVALGREVSDWNAGRGEAGA